MGPLQDRRQVSKGGRKEARTFFWAATSKESSWRRELSPQLKSFNPHARSQPYPMALWRGLPAYHPDKASSTESCPFSVREGGAWWAYYTIQLLIRCTRIAFRHREALAKQRVCRCRGNFRLREREGGRDGVIVFVPARDPAKSANTVSRRGKDAQSDKEGKERRGPSSFAVLALLPRYVFIHCRRPFCFRIAVYDLGRSNQGSATCCRRHRRRVLESGSSGSSSNVG